MNICERNDCLVRGRLYYPFGSAISTGPWTSASGSMQPDQPIVLCADHALQTFGTAFTSLPGEGVQP